MKNKLLLPLLLILGCAFLIQINSYALGRYQSRRETIIAQEMASRLKSIRYIVVDAGHGGWDPGALYPGIAPEKHIALEIAEELSLALRTLGYEVLMTRFNDVFVPLAERARLSNVKGGELFISVHVNASEDKNLRGFEVYYVPESSVKLDEADTLKQSAQAERVLNSKDLAERVVAKAREKFRFSRTRVKPGDFRVLNATQCPAILIETGYLSNVQDRLLLKSPIYRQRIVEAAASAVQVYAKEHKKIVQ